VILNFDKYKKLKYNIFSVTDTTEYYSGVAYDGKEYKLLEPGCNII